MHIKTAILLLMLLSSSSSDHTFSIIITNCQPSTKHNQPTLNTYHTKPAIMSTNDNTSTLKSYVDSATGYVQNVVGSVIGSTGDQVSTTATHTH